ncbi:MAG: cytochrome c [Paracoccaceae bacterium]
MLNTRSLVLGLAAGLVAATGLAAQDADLPAPVKARKAVMQLYAFNLGTLGAMAKGEVDYDAEAAQGAADNLVKLSSLAAGAMWPAGTDSAAVAGSRALPALWENFPDVMAKGGALAEAAGGMATAAGTDLASLQAAMGPLGAACGDCHKAYRAE